jgi:hypothetical protein
MIQAPSVPNLPIPKDEYSKLYLNQLTNVLRLYFNQLNDAVLQLTQYGTGTGGAGIAFPYGSFSCNADIKATAANTITAVTLNTSDFTNGTSLASNVVTAEIAGLYNLQFSIQLVNTDNTAHSTLVWLRKNGSDVAGTNSKFDVPARKSALVHSYVIGACNFYVSLNAGDTIGLVWAADAVENGVTQGIYFEAYAAQTSPYAAPSLPSSVVTLTFVSTL